MSPLGLAEPSVYPPLLLPLPSSALPASLASFLFLPPARVAAASGLCICSSRRCPDGCLLHFLWVFSQNISTRSSAFIPPTTSHQPPNMVSFLTVFFFFWHLSHLTYYMFNVVEILNVCPSLPRRPPTPKPRATLDCKLDEGRGERHLLSKRPARKSLLNPNLSPEFY